MMRYIHIYKTLLKLNLSQLLTYRGNAFSNIIASVCWGALSIASMLLLTTRVHSIYGWRKEELLILTGLYGIVIGIFHMVFTRNFERFATIIFRGELDQFLLKPLDSQFSLSLWRFSYITVFRIIMATIFTMYVIGTSSIHVSLINIFSFVFLIIFSLILLYAIWFILLTLVIWYPRLSNLIDLLYNLNDIARYPPEMFNQFRNIFVYIVLPFTFILISPLKALLNKLLVGDLIGLLVCSVGLFVFSRIFWKFALRHYTSTSS